MPRVRELKRNALPEDLRPLYDAFASAGGDFTNQLKVMAHAPAAFRHLYGLLDAWRSECSLPARLVEIAVVTTSRVNACAYCVAHHGLKLVGLGLRAETVEKILEPAPPGFDARDRAVRDYARLVTERAWGIPESAFAALREHLSDQQIVELTLRVGVCSLFNKLNQALEIEMEEPILAAVEAHGITAPSERRAGAQG